jgi:hypothetical protein
MVHQLTAPGFRKGTELYGEFQNRWTAKLHGNSSVVMKVKMDCVAFLSLCVTIYTSLTSRSSITITATHIHNRNKKKTLDDVFDFKI